MTKPQLELVPINETFIDEITDKYVLTNWNMMLNDNFKASGWTYDSNRPVLSDLFNWQEAPEGHEFWSLLNRLFTVKAVRASIPCGEIKGFEVWVLTDGRIKVGCTVLEQSQVDDISAAIAKQKEGE
jgi:hypothetical protein